MPCPMCWFPGFLFSPAGGVVPAVGLGTLTPQGPARAGPPPAARPARGPPGAGSGGGGPAGCAPAAPLT